SATPTQAHRSAAFRDARGRADGDRLPGAGTLEQDDRAGTDGDDPALVDPVVVERLRNVGEHLGAHEREPEEQLAERLRRAGRPDLRGGSVTVPDRDHTRPARDGGPEQTPDPDDPRRRAEADRL